MDTRGVPFKETLNEKDLIGLKYFFELLDEDLTLFQQTVNIGTFVLVVNWGLMKVSEIQTYSENHVCITSTRAKYWK